MKIFLDYSNNSKKTLILSICMPNLSLIPSSIFSLIYTEFSPMCTGYFLVDYCPLLHSIRFGTFAHFHYFWLFSMSVKLSVCIFALCSNFCAGTKRATKNPKKCHGKLFKYRPATPAQPRVASPPYPVALQYALKLNSTLSL